jgi:enterochelin esterase-like enzyme/sugar lactone lactonase YvrE
MKPTKSGIMKHHLPKYIIIIISVLLFKNAAYSDELGANAAHLKGSIFDGHFTQSSIFPGVTHDYKVYIPHQYNAAKPACLYVSQDGWNAAFTDAMDKLIEDGKMPVTIGVFISAGYIPSLSGTMGRRTIRPYEYNSLGDKYARFLIEDILPFIAGKYSLNLSKDGNDRCIGGSSSGGICALNVAWERPDAFRRVYSNSGSFVAYCGGDVFPTLIRKCEAKPIRVFLHGALKDLNNAGGNFYLTNQTMANALAFSGYDYKSEESEGAHGDKYKEGFGDAMTWLWRDYPVPITAGHGSRYLGTILVPGEQWTPVGGQFREVGSMAANAKGEVIVCDTAANRLYKIGADGKAALLLSNAMQVCGLTAGYDGRIYGISAATGKVMSFEDDGKNRMLAEGVFGSSIAAVRDGGFYVTGQKSGTGNVWHIDKNGNARIVDTGLRKATGVAISANGAVLHVADGGSHWVYSYAIGSDGALTNKENSIWLHVPDSADDSGAEAICVDSKERLFVATRMGIWVGPDQPYDNQGIISAPPGRTIGLCFGGPEFDTLFASCGDKVFMRKVKAKGH